MSTTHDPDTDEVIVETDLQFSLTDLSRICGADAATLEALVHEGALIPLGGSTEPWTFSGTALPRARRATRLVLDLELSAQSVALVLDLVDEIDSLKAQLRRLRA